jgi:methylenetetrahydrofolate reductase (NADPH)
MALLSTLQAKSQVGERLFTVEISPPVNYRAMVKTGEIVESLKDLDLSGVAVTNSTGGTFRLNPLAVADTIRAWLRDIPILVHLTARDEGSVRSVYNHIEEMGQKRISDVLVLRGDPTPANSRQIDSFKFSTVELVSLISDYSRGGSSNGAEKSDHLPAIDIFIAGHPEYPDPALGKHIAYQKKKVDGGAQGIIANIISDCERYARYVEAAEAHGLDVPIIPSVIPLTSFRRCQFLESKLRIPVPPRILQRLERASKDDALKIGIETSIAIANELLGYGAPGINFNIIFPHDVESVAEILREVRGHATIWEKYRIEDPEEIDYYAGLRQRRS